MPTTTASCHVFRKAISYQHMEMLPDGGSMLVPPDRRLPATPPNSIRSQPSTILPLLAVVVTLWTGPALADNYTWSGGAGATWDTTDNNWGGSGLTAPWDGSNGGTNLAVFNTSGATPGVSGTVFCNGITFGSPATIGGGTITLAGTTNTISLAGNQSSTINSVLAGSSGLKFIAPGTSYQGNGTLVLRGTNTYTGQTSIQGLANQSYTILRAGSAQAFGPAGDIKFPAPTGQNRHWLDVNGLAVTVAQLNAPTGNDGGGYSFGSYVGNFAAGTTATLIISNTADCYFGGALQNGPGAGSKLAIIKDGPGAFGIFNFNVYHDWSGGLSIKNGTFNTGSMDDGGWYAGAEVIMGDTGKTGTLRNSGGGTPTSSKTYTIAAGGIGAFKIDSGTTTLSGVIGGDGGLTKTGSGALIISRGGIGSPPKPAWGGDTTISGGTLTICGDYLADFANVYLTNGVVFNLNFQGTDSIGALYSNGVQQAAGTWGGVGSGANHTNAFLTGTGLLRVPDVCTWTGATDANWGTASNWSPGGPPGKGTLAIFPESGNYRGGAAVEWVGAKTNWMIRFDTTSKAVTLGPDVANESLTIDSIDVTSSSLPDYEIKADVLLTHDLAANNSSASSLLTISGLIGGAHSVTKTGTGALTLSGNNTFTGTMTISAGKLSLLGANSYTGATTISSGTLILGATGSFSNSPNINIATNAAFDVSAQSYVMSGTQKFTIDVNSAGAGSAGRITAAGLDIASGVLVLNITGALDDSEYVLATYTSIDGTEFASITGVPAGYGIHYAHNGGTQIALVPLTTLTWSGLAGAIWNTTGANWTPVTADPWTSGNGSAYIALFNTPVATPNVNGTVYANSIAFSESATISGGTVTLSGENPRISFSNNCSSATIGSVLAGHNGFTYKVLNGGGNGSQKFLTLNGANTYTGPTTVIGPQDQSWTILQAGNSQAFGLPAGANLLFTENGGQRRCWVDLHGFDITVDGLSSPGGNDGGGYAFGNFVGNWANGTTATLTVSNAVDCSFQGQLMDGPGTGKLALTKDGPGKFSGWKFDSNYSGQLTVRNGTFEPGGLNNVNVDGGLGHSALSVILGGTGTTATLITGAGSSDKPFALAASGACAFQVDDGTMILSGVINGSGNLVKTGAGTLALSATNNTYSGATIVSNGTLQTTAPTTLNAATSVYLYSSGGTMNLNFIGTNVVKNLVLDGVPLGNGVYGNGAAGGRISGNGFLEVVSIPWVNIAGGNWSNTNCWLNHLAPVAGGRSGYHIVYDTNSYTGGNSVNNQGDGFALNKLSFGTNQAAVTLSGNSLAFTTFDAQPELAQDSANNLVVQLNLRLDGTTTFGGSGAGTVSVSGVISGSGGLTKTSPGLLTLYGTNIWTGATTVTNGILRTTSQDTLSSSTTVCLPPGSGTLDLAFTGTNLVQGLVVNGVNMPLGVYGAGTGGGAFITGNGFLRVGVAAPLVNIAGGNWSIASCWLDGIAPGPGGRADYCIWYDAISYSGVSVNDLGEGFVLNELNFSTAQAAVTLSGQTLAFTNFSLLPQLNQNGTNAVTIQNNLSLGANATFGGTGTGTVIVLGAITGSGGLTKTGGSTLVLTTNNTYAGDTVIIGGVLKVQGGAIPHGAAAVYTFDNINGTQIVNEGSLGPPKDASLYGAASITSQSGHRGNGVSISGWGQGLVKVAQGPGNTGLDLSGGNWTASIWYRGLIGGNDWHTAFHSGNSDDYQAIINEGSRHLYTLWGGNTDTGYVMPSGDTGWHMLTVAGVPGYTRFYVDGACVASNSAWSSSSDIFSIGGHQGNIHQFANNLDDFYFYQRALNNDEVVQLYAATGGTGVNNVLPTNTVVLISTGGMMALGNPTNTVRSLYFNGYMQAAGTWGSSAAGAEHTNDTFFASAGTGKLLVTQGEATPRGTIIIVR